DPNEYLDTDKDGIGNNTDEDDDGDGYSDLDEITCNTDPLKRSSRPEDYDRDLSPDCVDTDDDNDGCLDQEDLFPLNERECIDTDGDGIGDNADMDADNDGIIDPLDDFPTDPNESKDTDGDGIGDNADLDDNNDGFPEDPIINDFDEEVIPIFVSELLTPNQTGEESTWRIVNIDKYPSANVKVYSPSGIIVYESWDYKNDWDGSGKDGKPLPSGPYYYRIDRGNETTVEEGWLYIFN
ncbi:gliding motility-associated C-terminal domain-containing protein, partial [Flavobacteriaceae bacterium]|nr:gliding motility-associated C-terminal domain-containing protein [Flavobacteriaceae bacterium]